MEWKKLIEKYKESSPYMKLNPPATEHQIVEVEKTLNIELPSDIRTLLKEFNGDNWLILSTDEIIEINESQRKAYDSYMTLDCILFIAGNGCGDYFGYPITRDGVIEWNIYIWEHETDNRIWKANGLEDMINKYYNNEI